MHCIASDFFLMVYPQMQAVSLMVYESNNCDDGSSDNSEGTYERGGPGSEANAG